MSLLDWLLDRGDHVALDRGKLIIKPISGLEVTADWLEKHPVGWLNNRGDTLALDLAARAGMKLYRFTGYTVGSYGEYKAPGVTLRFAELVTGEEVYAVFNVNRHRVRNTAHGKAGSKLPGNQFRITKHMALYKFWLSTGLPEPSTKHLSEFHLMLSKRVLKTVFFTMRASDGKADKATIQAATAPGAEQQANRGQTRDRTGEGLGIEQGINRVRKQGEGNTAKPSAVGLVDDSKHVPQKVRLKLISKDVNKPALSTCNTTDKDHERSVVSSVVLEEQSVDEWLQEYEA